MANGWFQKSLAAAAEGGLNWTGGNVKWALVITGAGHFVVDLVNNHFLTDIALGDRPFSSNNLTTKTNVGGVLGSDPAVFTAPAGGTTCQALVCYVDTGVAGTSPMLFYVDTVGAGLPITTNGLDVTLDPAIVGPPWAAT